MDEPEEPGAAEEPEGAAGGRPSRPSLPGTARPRFAYLGRLARGSQSLLTPWRDLDLERMWQVIFHAVLIGALAGSFASLFFYALEWTSWLSLDVLAGVGLPRAGGEMGITPETPSSEGRRWLLLILPTLGGLGCGLLVYKLAPSAAGPGGDAYIDAFHHRAGLMGKRVPFAKALASLMIIGTGGSAGREGPTLHVSAGIGSLLSRLLRLGPRERRILLAAGAAAGTGAMFRTPLGGALFAVEVLYRDDFETDAIVPCIVASVTGYSVVTVAFGPAHLLTTASRYEFMPEALPLYALMAIGLSLFAVTYVALRHFLADHVFGAFGVKPWLTPALGGLLLGAFALFVPEVLGTGYGILQRTINTTDWMMTGGAGVLLLFGLATAKMVASSLTVSSGGAAGDIGPGFVVGGIVGGAFGLFFHEMAPGLVPQPGAFALVGMGAFVGGITHAPVSTLIMVCELVGSYDLLAPLMIAEAVTFILLRRVAIYRNQVPGRLDSPAHAHELTVDVLEAVKVRDVYEPGHQMARARLETSAAEVLDLMTHTDLPAVLVADEEGHPVGIVSLESVQGLLAEEALVGVVAADMILPAEEICLDTDLHVALRAFLVADSSVLPVVEAPGGAVVGIITHAQVDEAYERAVGERVRSSAE